MQIEIRINKACPQPKIIIEIAQMTEEISNIVKRISDDAPLVILGFDGDIAKVLDTKEIIRIAAFSGKVLALTPEAEYTLKIRLYEAEERLKNNKFVRISNSEIINLEKVQSFDLSFTGTICVKLSNGVITYVSRRYVAKIKQLLGI